MTYTTATLNALVEGCPWTLCQDFSIHPYSDIVCSGQRGTQKQRVMGERWWWGGHVTITAVGDLPLVVN